LRSTLAQLVYLLKMASFLGAFPSFLALHPCEYVRWNSSGCSDWIIHDCNKTAQLGVK